MFSIARERFFMSCIAAFIVFVLSSRAEAYVDPGTLGTTYQIGYIIFYVIISGFIFLFRPISNLLGKVGKKLIGKKAKDNKTDDVVDPSIMKACESAHNESN